MKKMREVIAATKKLDGNFIKLWLGVCFLGIMTVIAIEAHMQSVSTTYCNVRLTDIGGIEIPKTQNGKWVLGADQDVLVWLDLPGDIDNFYADLNSSYPYNVKRGESGVIEFDAYCWDNERRYTGKLEFIAADNLTLGAVCNGTNLRNQEVCIKNDTFCNFSWMQPGEVHAYVHYPLYTSCAGNYEVYQIKGTQDSYRYRVEYDINAVGAPAQDHVDSYPGETAWKEAHQKMIEKKLLEPCPPEPRYNEESTEEPKPVDLGDDRHESPSMTEDIPDSSDGPAI